MRFAFTWPPIGAKRHRAAKQLPFNCSTCSSLSLALSLFAFLPLLLTLYTPTSIYSSSCSCPVVKHSHSPASAVDRLERPMWRRPAREAPCRISWRWPRVALMDMGAIIRDGAVHYRQGPRRQLQVSFKLKLLSKSFEYFWSLSLKVSFTFK